MAGVNMSEQLAQQGVSNGATTATQGIPETFKVKVHDLHTEDRFEYSVPTMNDAINLYKQVVAAARNVESRPFVYLDDAQWLALVKYTGGLVRMVFIADSTGKVRGHNAGMRRREQQAANPVVLPPTIVAAPKAVAQPAPVRPEATPEQMATPEVEGEQAGADTEKVPF